MEQAIGGGHMTTSRTGVLTYPAGGFGATKDRRGNAGGDVGLPEGTEVFSADDHISLAEDIFYERFPESLKEQAPRVVYEDGAWTLAIGGRSEEHTSELLSLMRISYAVFWWEKKQHENRSKLR